MKIDQAVILCGGIGKRLMPLTKNTPKPMVKVNNKPFLEYIISDLKKFGFKKILLLVGYKSIKIKEYFGDGRNFNILIEYHEGPVFWETGKRIFEARNLLESKFLLLYSDNILSLNYKKLLQNYNNQDIFFVLKNKIPGNFFVKNGMIKKYSIKRNKNYNFIELGFTIYKKKPLIDFLKKKNNTSINYYFSDRVKNKKNFFFIHEDIYVSISDIFRYSITKNYLKNKKIILLDRDGTITQSPGKGKYLISDKKIKYIKKNIKLLKSLSKKKFKFIIISNQACVALKKINCLQLNKINNKINFYLKRKNIRILDTYFCPHHWNDNCQCRKPKPGMFYALSKKYNLNLSKVIFIGDDIRDMEAAKNANCKAIFLSQNYKRQHNYLKDTILISSKNINLIEKKIIKFYEN